jgi:amino acid adenylation domain-containing protein
MSKTTELTYSELALCEKNVCNDQHIPAAEQLAYWKQQLKDAPLLLGLPTDRPRAPLHSYHAATQSFALPGQLDHALRMFSQHEGVSLYVALTAAFQTLLYRYSGQDDLLLAAITAGSACTGGEKASDPVLDTVALRTDMSGNPTFRELLRQTREVFVSAMQHSGIAFASFVNELYPGWSLSYQPLVQALISYHPLALAGSPGAWMESRSYPVQFDLCLAIDERVEGLCARCIYNSDLFDASTIKRMIGHFQTLLAGIVADPTLGLAQLPLLSEGELQQVLEEWNATQTINPREVCVHRLFEAQVERTPDAEAVVCEQQRLTYRELNARANQLAHHLREKGVGADVMVGLCVERSIEMLIGLLGILKAGGVYVPLDPEYPIERLSFVVQDTRMRVLLTQQRLLGRLAELEQRVQRFCLDGGLDVLEQRSAANPGGEIKAEQLAYVIYTSGSTGRPKGVLIQHHSLAVHSLGMAEVYGLRRQDRVLQFSSYTFDASLEQILPPLLVGAQLLLRGQEVWSPAQLLRQLELRQVSVVNLPSAYWHQLARAWQEEPAGQLPHRLRLLIVGGERLQPEALQLWRQLPLHAVRLLNAYGPTETTITATVFDTACYEPPASSACGSVPIGRPTPNRRIYILDHCGAPVPIGVPGELHIGGDVLSCGYLNLPALTSERFVADPFSADPRARLYKSGDLARYQADGAIEFLGRVDQQVKIRGFRIELGEIEAVLRQYPAVAEAVVVARDDASGEKHLAAYVVARPGGEVQGEERRAALRAMREHLRRKLPAYMLPTAFVFLKRLPLLASGKIDRNALPAPEVGRHEELAHVADPELLIHQKLVQIWEELLDVRPIGIRDNFFHLGGHSLLAACLIDRIEHVFGKSIALSALFSGPTIEQLAEALQRQINVETRTALLPLQVDGAKRPFFFLHGDWTGGAFYCFNLARALGSDQPFYVLEPYKFAGLRELPSFEEVAAAHIEALRAVQAEGPYLLGGFCNGGLLAYEMARQLEAVGERVDFLALINPAAPVQYTALRAIGQPLSKLLGLGDTGQARLFLRTRHALRHLYRKVLPRSSRVQDFAKLLAIDPRLACMFPPLEALYNDYVNVFTWLVARYVTGGYSGRITFFWAQEELAMLQNWRTLAAEKASQGVENHIVPGALMTCVTEHIRELAECLSSCEGWKRQNGAE